MTSLGDFLTEAFNDKTRYLIKATKSSSGYIIKYFDMLYDKSDYAVFDGKRFIEKDSGGSNLYTGGLDKLQYIFRNTDIDPAMFIKSGNLGQVFALVTKDYPHGKIDGCVKYKYIPPRNF